MKHLKILFADDDLKYAMILKRFLEAEGYEVFYAGNGRIALEQYPEVKPDLVLLDINMPEVNGYEVARQIREHDSQTVPTRRIVWKALRCGPMIIWPNLSTRRN